MMLSPYTDNLIIPVFKYEEKAIKVIENISRKIYNGIPNIKYTIYESEVIT